MLADKLNVLVVDDDEDDLFLTCDYLSRVDTFTLNIDQEINYKKALHKILQDNHDIYFVDYLLGPHTGIELIREAIKGGITKPFILLTGRGDKRIDIEATDAGAYDYLTKTDLNTELIERSLRYSLHRYLSFTAIVESENRYREIFIKSNDIILLLDKNFRLVTFNPMMTTLMGYTAEELSYRSITDFFAAPEEASKFIRHIEDNQAENKIEIILKTKSGSRKIFLASSSLISTIDGTGQYQAILYDYTNIKKAVSEQLLKEGTERLVRSMAHEIRNPLTNINLSLYELEKGIADDQKPLADIIKRNSNRINDMISDLINLSNPVDKTEDHFELAQLVRSSVHLATDRIKLKEIRLNEEYNDNGAYIVGDLKKLQMAILNIIINAIEAMEPGHGSLLVKTELSGSQALIEIKDNGYGIPPENLPHLFQPYFTQKKNGLGLGLAATHSIIHAHNGNIEVQSTPGEGSVFKVALKATAL
jgi:PAS domain S-box-containing protein